MSKEEIEEKIQNISNEELVVYIYGLEHEISLMAEEYEVLKVTSQDIEDEQAREIYELKLKLDKISKYIDNNENNFSIKDLKSILNNEDKENE